MFNTASVRSKISYIDGDKGILRYRGYPIEQLAEKSTFLEARDMIPHSYGPVVSNPNIHMRINCGNVREAACSGRR